MNQRKKPNVKGSVCGNARRVNTSPPPPKPADKLANIIPTKMWRLTIKSSIKKLKRISNYKYMNFIKLRNQFNDILDLNGKFCKLKFKK